jgi:hypothetical protein
MATTFADLEARVRGLESRAQRTDEDITAVITTVVEVRDDVRQLKDDVGQLKDDVGHLKREMRWTKRGVAALLGAQGLSVAPDPGDGESDL